MPKLALSVEKTRDVLGDWDRLRNSDPNYLMNGGRLVFMHLFEECPEAKLLFGFTMTTNPRSKAMLRSNRFKRHAKFLLKMLDKTIDLLDSSTTSDDEHGRGSTLTDTLIDLGRKHVAYGVQSEHLVFMGISVVAMLEDTIGDPHAEAWTDVFRFLVEQMRNGYQRVQKDATAAVEKNRCLRVWDKFTKIRHYRRTGGVILFQHLFIILPDSKEMFGFPKDMDPLLEEFVCSHRFGMHAEFLIEMIEKAITMLSHDDQSLEDELIRLGQRHVAFGVKEEHFPYMTVALIHMLKEMLKTDFNAEDEVAFKDVMGILITDMVKGQRKVDKELSGNKKEVVLATWAQLRNIKDYDTKGGIIIFQNLFETCPEAQAIFGYPKTIDPKSVEMNLQFKKHAAILLRMIEKGIAMLGQDDTQLENTLVELGKKHVGYGVEAEYFPAMSKAILQMLNEMLGDNFTQVGEEAWSDILSMFITGMIHGQHELEMEHRRHNIDHESRSSNFTPSAV